MRLTVTIATGNSISSVAAVDAVSPAARLGFPPVPVQFFSPSSLPSTVKFLSFHTSHDGATFKPMHDSAGLVTIPFTSAINSCVRFGLLAGARFFKVQLLDEDQIPVQASSAIQIVIGFSL